MNTKKDQGVSESTDTELYADVYGYQECGLCVHAENLAAAVLWSEFDGKAKRSQSMEAELIMDIVMPELYEERPPAEIAEMEVGLLPEIRRERHCELRQQRAEGNAGEGGRDIGRGKISGEG